MHLVVDPIACDGRGLCAEVLPAVVTLDDWGFPIVSSEELGSATAADASEAVRICPRLALRLVT